MCPSTLSILVCPVNAVGHINACIGSTSALLQRGHRVAFVVEQAWSGRLSPLGIKEYLFSVPSQTGKVTAALIAEQFKRIGLIGPLSPKQKTLNLLTFFNSEHITDEWRHYDGAIKAAIADFKPDCILADENGLPPAIYYSGVPWIRHFSSNPLFFIMESDLPPGGSGLPFDDRSEWADFNRVRGEFIHSKLYNDFIEKQLGYARYSDDIRTPPTQLMTIYACPNEWNYPPLKEKADWFNLEAFNKPKAAEQLRRLDNILPKDFINDQLEGRFSGKYIYVSLGSMGSIDLDLMRKLVEALATSPHKYIISKGPLADEYDLPGLNQWGDRFLPQLDILPQVNLVITHGGNNSITEIYATGKPMIVLALFGDQYDNAQRLHETGFGVKLDPYNFTADELLNAIEKLLSDDVLQEKLDAAAKRIQQSDTHVELARTIERLMVQQ